MKGKNVWREKIIWAEEEFCAHILTRDYLAALWICNVEHCLHSDTQKAEINKT